MKKYFVYYSGPDASSHLYGIFNEPEEAIEYIHSTGNEGYLEIRVCEWSNGKFPHHKSMKLYKGD